MAHKKAAGSAKNLRDSNAKYRGVKLFGGQTAQAGNIIIRQKGDKFQLGKNVYKGADFTVHAAIDGIVTFKKKNINFFDKPSSKKILNVSQIILSISNQAFRNILSTIIVIQFKIYRFYYIFFISRHLQSQQ